MSDTARPTSAPKANQAGVGGSEREQESQSLTRIAMHKLGYHRMALYGGALLVLLYTVALFADFVSPYGFEKGARLKNEHPPTTIRWFDHEGKLHRPFVYNTVKMRDEFLEKHYVETAHVRDDVLTDYYRKYYEIEDPAELERMIREEKYRRYPIKLFARGDTHHLLWTYETRTHLFGIEEDDVNWKVRPTFFLLGSDEFGRCLFSRLLFASRISLSVGLVGVAITFTLGMLIGGISGYYGGWVDIGIQRLCEVFMMVPGFYLLLALRAAVPAELSSTQVYLAIIIILSFIGWAGLARTIRGLVLSQVEMDYVQAAKALGVGDLRIIWKHILPNTLSYAIVSATVAIPGYILGESALSFLGLGIQEPQASWGNMLKSAQSVTQIKLYPWILAPGFLIFIAVMAFNFLGDGLRDAFDPKSVIEVPPRDGDDAGDGGDGATPS